jgi:hypothetical protein
MPLRQISLPVFVLVPGPADPGYGIPDWGPVDPGYGVGGLHPSHGLPGGGLHPGGGPVYGGGRPVDPGYGVGGLHPSNKPPGAPIIPVGPDIKPPNGGAPPHPWLPGHWVPVDPGYGKPPLWGYIPVDPGYGVGEGAPDNTLPGSGGGKPDNTLPGSGGRPDNTLPGGGTWVPVDPGWGVPGCPPCNCGGSGNKPGQLPVWVWIPKPPDLTKPAPLPTPK